MAKKEFEQGITSRKEDFSQWYIDTILKAEMADYSCVRGCMNIKPYGFALWENIRDGLDRRFKETGHQNAYFPMFVPESFLKKEAEHVEGFAPEVPWVTHVGSEPLAERLAIRPTSETVICAAYAEWIHSYRDLPVLINQWANVVRWEKRTRLFLRTTEFLWQEGHTAHATAEEAQEETMKMLEVYRAFSEEYMAIPVYTGVKSQSEKFAGAVNTYAIEAMMQDKKALQAGTSHNLGQNFAKAFDVTFQDKDGNLSLVWATSWGVSTRLIGAIIMAHSDDKGLVLPPKLAPTQTVIIPIYRNQNKAQVLAYAERLRDSLKGRFRTEYDPEDNNSPGWKFAEWELLGVPVRIEVGPKDMEAGKAVLVRRDTGEKIPVPIAEVPEKLEKLLADIQISLYKRALEYRNANTVGIEDYQSFLKFFEAEGGFAESPWCGSPNCEATIKETTKATIRVLPFGNEARVKGNCVCCGKPAKHLALFAKSY